MSPLRFRKLRRKLARFDRADDYAAIVIPKPNVVPKPRVLTVSVLHLDERS